MILFLRKIPKNTTVHDIKKFVMPALVKFMLFKSNNIVDIRILHLYDTYLHVHEYHGLVTIQKYNKQIISKLNNVRLRGKRIIVREFVTRTWHNDKRSNHAIKSDKMGTGRRCFDRRRGQRLVEILTDEHQLLKMLNQ